MAKQRKIVNYFLVIGNKTFLFLVAAKTVNCKILPFLVIDMLFLVKNQ